MSVTLRDIAREAGVSIATVSKVLRDEPAGFIGEATRTKVTAVARRLGYRQNQYARSLRLGKSELIGLMAFDVNIRVVLRKLEAVDRAVRARGYRTAVWSAAGQADAERRALDECQSQQADGLIVVHPSAHLTAEMFRPLIGAGTPLMMLDPIPALAADCLTIDRRRGTALAVSHLLGLGHVRIALIHGDLRYETDRGRLLGYQEAHADAAVTVDETLALEAGPGYRGGYVAAQALLARRVSFTAAFCNNDEVAIGALRAFREAGLRVPEDVAMVGFDDIEAAEFAATPLTTVAQPVEEQARAAVERLFTRIAAPDEIGPPELRSLAPTLVVRDSCGASRGLFGPGRDPISSQRSHP
jgi:DNA-binding LacI/PurR family transcriptional regulator